jgi:hypothetical protein
MSFEMSFAPGIAKVLESFPMQPVRLWLHLFSDTACYLLIPTLSFPSLQSLLWIVLD